ncbi:MAG: hypothetical protein ACI978_001001 [Oleispira sp.]|jgi:uncharacterized protein involved in type VI secretion and phage assembly
MSTPTFKLTVDSHELTLVEFDGVEELNRLFKYTFTTEIPTGVALASMIDGDATFTIEEYDTNLHTGDIDIPGYISTASKSNGYWVLEFSPKLLKTTTNSRAEIYFQEDGLLSASAVIDLEFQNDILLNDRSAVFEISPSLPTRKLFCQLHESNFNFVARLCDHWGFHFYFDHFLTQIVFADNNLYDQVFTTQLKTTSATADNSPLKIINWQEEIKAVESYTTVIGHDHANAGTAITASSPSDTTSQGSLTENRLTLADVNSQAEADYIALVRQQSNNCMNHNASGESKVPYIFPGFLIDTDDSDFTKAFVVSTVSSGRNLNSANAGDASTYTCSFRAIPNSAVFRPTAHYQIPTATNVYGKIISETSNLSQAQRNQAGEYKVDLLGFENESSAHPWLRKTQTTAGSNSVDIPLLPDTEVLIAFADSNPNCPFILAAADNSLQPSPVTNANPHHAVIKTGGMLVTSSLEGRYNYAITSKTLEIDSAYTTLDSEISPSTKNYFTGRGKFDQHTNFIDPSSTSAIEFSNDDEGSGDYIFTRFSGDSVEIRQGDKMHWHNGNLYDFGGYWNYNLGNSYEENFIDQAAPLNTKVDQDSLSGDILPAGPNPGEISFSSLEQGGLDEDDVKPASYSDTGVATTTTGKTFKVNSEGAWDANGMNITKDYNATYDYKFGEGIEISDRVNSLEVTHTDAATTAIEMNFHKGILRSWEKKVGRNTDEKKWAGNGNKTFEGSSSFDSSTNTKTEKEKSWDVKGDTKIAENSTITTPDSITTDQKSYNMNTGALSAHNIKTTNGMATAEMDFSFDATAASKFNFGASTSFSIAAQADASLAISLTGGVDIKLEAGMNLEVKLSGGMTFEMKKDLGGLYKFKNGKFVAETEATILAATTAATLEAMGPTIKSVQAEITSTNAKLRKEMVTLDQSNVKLDTSYLVVFS